MGKRKRPYANEGGCKRRRTKTASARNSASDAAGNETIIYNRSVQPVQESVEVYDTVDPWTAFSKKATGFDYEEIIMRLNCVKVDRELVQKIEALIGRRVHHLISRYIAVSHRGMDSIIKHFKASLAKRSDGFYLYTGRGPSSKAMHLGHAIPFILTKWFQDTFNVPLVIQITDDEKFLWKDIDIEDATTMANENIKDIIAFGFDPRKTYIFTDTGYMCPEFYKNICRIEKLCSVKSIKDRFGFDDDDCIGKLTFPAIQAAPSISSSFPDFLNGTGDMLCLIPCAIDQDAMFMMAREIAPKVNVAEPAVLHTQFLTSLKNPCMKMSSSHPEGAIFLSDTSSEIERKIRTCKKEIVLQYLCFFMEDDARFELIQEESKSRTVQNLRTELAHVLTEFSKEFRSRRKNITPERVKMFMSQTKYESI